MSRMQIQNHERVQYLQVFHIPTNGSLCGEVNEWGKIEVVMIHCTW